MAEGGQSRKVTLHDPFIAFAKFGDVRSNGAEITLTNVDKWLKQANIFGKRTSANEAAIIFKQIAKKKRTLNLNEFQLFIQNLSKSYGMNSDDMVDKLVACGLPDTVGTTPYNDINERERGGWSKPVDLPIFENTFIMFAKFGCAKNSGNRICLSNIDKWFRQACIFDEDITTVDTGIIYKQICKKKLGLKIPEFLELLKKIASFKRCTLNDLKRQLIWCGPPSLSCPIDCRIDNVYKRLTDVNLYTGTHKHRFHQSGKGKGLDGRREESDFSGYVTGYRDKDTYDMRRGQKYERAKRNTIGPWMPYPNVFGN